MKKFMKRTLAAFLVVLLALTSAPLQGFVGFDWDFGFSEWFSSRASALSSSGKCGNNVYYTFNSSTGELVISGTGEMYDYSYNESPFYNDGYIKKVVIENGVTRIGKYAFSGCTGLRSVTIPNSVTSIGNYAFGRCENLKSVTIPNSVTNIDDYAFSSCLNLISIKISKSVTSIADSAFRGCDALTNIMVDIKNQNYSNDSYGVLFDKNKTKLIQYPASNESTSYTIPSSVTNIGSFAFSGCRNLTSVTIPNSVTSIGECAFRYCRVLTSITIPNSITSIPRAVFYGCDSLATVTIPNSVTSIGNSAFYGCKNLTSVTIPNSVTSIGNYTFYDCSSLASVTIGNSVTSIGEATFYSCSSLASITISDSITSISEYAFYDCSSLTDVYYTGSEEQWNKISISYSNEYLTNATIHYNCDPNISSDTSKFLLNSSKQQIIIRPKDATGNFTGSSDISNFLNMAFEPLNNVTVNDATGSVTLTDYYYIFKEFIDGQPMTLSCNDFYDYVIPKQVISSWSTDNGMAYIFDALMQKNQKDKSIYVSTVFGREAGNGAYFDLRTKELEVIENKRYDVIITACGLNGNAEYYISQDNGSRIHNSTGVFSSEDLFSALDYSKDTYAYVMTSDGTTSNPVKINLKKCVAQDEYTKKFLNGSEVSLIGQSGQKLKIGDDFPLVGGAELSMKAFTFPIGVDVNGSDVKISIGIDVFSSESENGEKYKNTWYDFKKSIKTLDDAIEDSEDAMDKYQKFADDFIDKNNLKQKSYNNKSNQIKVTFLGYAEGSIVDGKLVFKEALVKVGGKFTFKYTQQTAVWVVPAYFYVEAGAEISMTGKYARLLADNNIPLDLGLILEITPELKLGGGAGVKDAASVGIWGKGSLPFSNNFIEKHVKLSLKGEFGWEAEFFVIKGEGTLLEGEFKLLDKYYGTKAKMLRSYQKDYADLKAGASQETEVSLVSRDYAENMTEWLGEYPVSVYGLADNGMSFNVLQASIFDQSNPQIVSFGDKAMMTWVQDDTSRDTYNRMRLVYSLYDAENNSWSEPKAVYDDGKNDAYPSLASDGKNVYVAWQKINKTITSADVSNVDAFVENSEIFLAKYDAVNDKFVNAQQLTNNSVYDYAPSVVVNNGTAAVYYATNNDNNLNGTNNNTLYRQQADKSDQALADKLNYIICLTPEAVNGTETLSYSVDTDGDMSTSNDVSVYTLANGKAEVFDKGENDVAYTYASYGMLDGKNTLFVSDSNNIYYQSNGETKQVFTDSRLIEGNIKFVENASSPSFIWTENNKSGGNEFFSTSYENGAWTEPVQISDIGGYSVSKVDVTMLGGQLIGVCNINQVTKNSKTGEYTQSAANLCSFEANDFSDIALELYMFDETKIVPGKTSEIDVYVTNNGTTKVDTVEFTVSDTLGTAKTYSKKIDLKSGDTENITLEYPVPENYTATTLSVSAKIPNTKESDSDNNSVSIAIGKCDLAVEQSELVCFGDNYLLKATVENNSSIDSKDVEVSAVFNSEDSEPFKKSDLGTLKKGEYVVYELAFNKSLLEFDENGIGKLYLNASSSTAESANADNQICVAVSLPQETECAHPLTERVDGKVATCTEKGYEAYEICTSCGEKIGYKVIDEKAHSFTEKVIDADHLVSAATTTSPAVYRYTCSSCKAISDTLTFTYGEKLPTTLGKPNLKAVEQNTSAIKITWTAVQGAAGYKVYRKIDGKWKALGNVTGTSVTLKKLKAGTKYTYAIRAGAKVDGKVVWAKDYLIVNTATKAVAPSKVTAKQNTSAIQLSWTKCDGATGYRIYYKSGNSWKTALSTTTATSHTFKKLKASAKYTFAVRPYIQTESGVVWSSYTQFITATKPANVTAKATSTSKGTVSLTWDKVNGAELYQVYYKTGNGSFKLYKTYTDVKSLSFKNLKSGTKYTFAVRAGIKTDSGNIYGGYKTSAVTVK